MLYVVVGLAGLLMVGVTLYSSIKAGELKVLADEARSVLTEREAAHAAAAERFRQEAAKLERFAHIPGAIEKIRRAESEAASKLAEASRDAERLRQSTAEEVERVRTQGHALIDEARAFKEEARRLAERDAANAKGTLLNAEARARSLDEEARVQARSIVSQAKAEVLAGAVVEAAKKEAKEISSIARKEAKEKTSKAQESLDTATQYALEVRSRAEQRAAEIAGAAFEALREADYYAQKALAMKNVVSGYGDSYLVPAHHVLDEWAYDYGFHKAGERLKTARDRSKVMRANGTAATCNYSEGWQRKYAIGFVLSAFDGKVDSVLARIKSSHHGRLAQEIRDAYTLVNHDGEVFRNARIHEEYLDSRLEELKWAVAVQALKEKDREEQRAIREQMREEARARREHEQAVRQAQREEDLLTNALAKARQDYEAAAVEDRARHEAEVRRLTEQVREAVEEKIRKISLAQQTKQGHVYVISNTGSFGENVFKIGMSRRLYPYERVQELGGASVPFAFDVHAMIKSADAPALEAALHRRFACEQVNKVNRRKEFFRLKMDDLRDVVEGMKLDASWTTAAEAREYQETLEIERRLREDPEFRRRWYDEQAAAATESPIDDEAEEMARDDRNEEFREDRSQWSSTGPDAAPKRPASKRRARKPATERPIA